MLVTACPPLDVLLASCTSSVVDVAPELAAHVEGCADCQHRLERHSPAPASLHAGLRRVAESPPDDPVVQSAIDRLLADAPAPLLAGCRLGEYELIEKLGEGGMGAVWKARHTRLDKLVALKVLSRRLDGEPTAEERFAREMRAVGRLQHINIVQASDAGEAKGRPFLVMELLEGRDLARLVREGGPLPVAEACGLVRQAALGLQHAHDAGLIHRDVKPSNLLLGPDGVIKVLDLGLALFHEESPLPIAGEASTAEARGTGTGRMLGTRDYMAPEQGQNPHAVDARADVYGLGCTLLFLLTGRPPRQVLPPAARPAALAAVLDKLLADDPAQRYPTAAAVASALEPLSRPVRPSWRLPVILAALLAVGGGAALKWGRHEQIVLGQLPMTPDAARELQSRWAAHLRAPVVLTDSVGADLILIPPGVFGLSTECRVTISKPYRLQSTEVTHVQFKQFIAATGYITTPESTGRGGFIFDRRDPHFMTRRKPEYIWKNPGHDELLDDQPATQVSWVDANAYCKWRTEVEGATYRLPTEAEWRWACRAGSSTDYFFGDDKKQLGNYAWYLFNSGPQPNPVGKLEPNAWGLFDTIGNVDEWCLDWKAPFPAGSFIDFVGTEEGKGRVIAGGSFYMAKVDCNTRDGSGAPVGFGFVGFRVLREQ